MSRRPIVVAVGLVGVWLAVLGFLVGMVVERVRFDGRRAVVLGELARDARRVRAYLMDLEQHAGRMQSPIHEAAGISQSIRSFSGGGHPANAAAP